MKFYMKQYLILILFLIGLIGCSKNKFEVDSIDDQDYLSIYDKVDRLPVVIIPDSDEVYDEITNKFQQMVLDSSQRKRLSTGPFDLSRKPTFQANFMCRIYLNENGKIDKLNFIIDPNPELRNVIINAIRKWKFISAKRDGKNVKCQFDWIITQSSRIVSSLPNEDFPLSKVSAERTEAEIMEIIKNMPDKMPEPVGGIEVIQKKIHYPEIAKRAGIEGKVFITAYVDKNGNVTKTEILKEVGTGLDEAAATAVAQTKFIPAMKNGKVVEAHVVIPILFKLDSSNSTDNVQSKSKNLKKSIEVYENSMK